MLHWINETCVRVVVGAVNPIVDFLWDGGARYYWLYCITGLVIAAFVYRKRKPSESFLTTLRTKDVWLSKSAINDYIILIMTPVLKLTILAWATVNWKSVSAFVVSVLKAVGVAGTVNDGTAATLGLALTFSLFIVDDFLRWYVHYVFHKVPELWEFHKVHHSAEVLNFATAERFHPFELVITGAVLAAGMGLVNGLFIGFFGDKLTITTVAGANLFLFLFNVAGGALRHSPFWISFGPKIEKWVISPAMHQIHHSDRAEHYDRNMGGSLAIWDRMFGTLHIPKGREIEGFGIGPETHDFRSMEVIMVRPFEAAARLLGKRMKRALQAGDVTHANGEPVES